MSARAIARMAIAVALVGCAPASPCTPWAIEGRCELPALAPAQTVSAIEEASAIALAIDARGDLVVAASGADGGHARVRVLEERSGALTPRTWPSDLDVVVDMPALDVGPSGEAAIAVRAGPDGATADVLVATRDAAGVWHEPTRSETTSLPPRAYEPRVAFTPSGALVVVMNQGAASRSGYGVRVCQAASAASPLACPETADDVLSLPTFFSNRPRPALGARGGGVISWYQSLGGPLRAFVSQRASEQEAFAAVTEEDAVSLPDTPVDSGAPPTSAASADGTGVVAWGQEDGRGGVAVYVAIRRPDGAIERPTSERDRISRGDQPARQVEAAIAEDGTIFVAWAGRTDAHEHVWLARIAPGRAAAQARVDLVSPLEIEASAPALAVSTRGELAIAYVEHGAQSERLWLRRGDLEGALDEAERVVESRHVGSAALAFGRASRRFAIGWVDASGAHVAATTP